MTKIVTRTMGALALCLALAACESSEERAQRHFSTALALLEEGDVTRAMIELRNVFKYDGTLAEPRLTYARLLRDQGEVRESFSQYLRLVEQHPDAADFRAELARYAFELRNWDEFERQAQQVVQLAPEGYEAQVLQAGLDFRAAAMRGEEEAQGDAADRLRVLRDGRRAEAGEEDVLADAVIVDHLVRLEHRDAAVAELDTILERVPDNLDFQSVRLGLLVAGGRTAETEGLLLEMTQRFPDRPEFVQALLQLFADQGRVEDGETFLRNRLAASEGPERAVAGEQLVGFLAQFRGLDPALEEVALLLPELEGEAALRLRGIEAELYQRDGQYEEAISRLTVLAEETTGEALNFSLREQLAVAYVNAGRLPEAYAVSEALVADDASNVVALKLLSRQALEAQDPSTALVHLRTAVNAAPRDVSIVTMMGSAYLLAGNTDLASERFAEAYDMSGQAAGPAMRYAELLRKQGRATSAARVLEGAHAVDPGNADVTLRLAEAYLSASQWHEAQRLVDEMRGSSDARVQSLLPQVQGAILFGRERVDDSLSYLADQIGSGAGDVDGATRMYAQILLRTGRVEEAVAFVQSKIAEGTPSLTLRLLDANLLAVNGQLAPAEEKARAMIEDFPRNAEPPRLLYGLLRADGRNDDAAAVLAAALERMPESEDLQWYSASEMEAEGDIDGAIAVYDQLYRRNPENLIAANNLASLLATYREDGDSLVRAYTIARRFRDMEVPALQDTYGWIALRRGDTAEAIDFLTDAAAGLPADPLAQYHYAAALHAVGRREEAEAVLARVRDMELPATYPYRDALTSGFDEAG